MHHDQINDDDDDPVILGTKKRTSTPRQGRGPPIAREQKKGEGVRTGKMTLFMADKLTSATPRQTRTPTSCGYLCGAASDKDQYFWRGERDSVPASHVFTRPIIVLSAVSQHEAHGENQTICPYMTIPQITCQICVCLLIDLFRQFFAIQNKRMGVTLAVMNGSHLVVAMRRWSKQP
jgi:hypothetical protein